MAEEELKVKVTVVTEGDDPAEIARGVDQISKSQETLQKTRARGRGGERDDIGLTRSRAQWLQQEAKAAERSMRAETSRRSAIEHDDGPLEKARERSQIDRMFKSSQPAVQMAPSRRKLDVSAQTMQEAEPFFAAVRADAGKPQQGQGQGQRRLDASAPTLSSQDPYFASVLGLGEGGDYELDSLLDEFAGAINTVFSAELGTELGGQVTAGFLDGIHESLSDMDSSQKKKLQEGLASVIKGSQGANTSALSDLIEESVEGADLDGFRDLLSQVTGDERSGLRGIIAELGESMQAGAGRARSTTLRGAAMQSVVQTGGSMLSRAAGGAGIGMGTIATGALMGVGLGAAFAAARGMMALASSINEAGKAAIESQRQFDRLTAGMGNSERAAFANVLGEMGGTRAGAYQMLTSTQLGLQQSAGFGASTAAGFATRAGELSASLAESPRITSSEAQSAASSFAQGDFSGVQSLGIDITEAEIQQRATERGFIGLVSASDRLAIAMNLAAEKAEEYAGGEGGQAGERDTPARDEFSSRSRRGREIMGTWARGLWDSVSEGASALFLDFIEGAQDGTFFGTGPGGNTRWSQRSGGLLSGDMNVAGPSSMPTVSNGTMLGSILATEEGQERAASVNSNRYREGLIGLGMVDPTNRIAELEELIANTDVGEYPERVAQYTAMLEQAYQQRISMGQQYAMGIQNIEIGAARSREDIWRSHGHSIEDMTRSFNHSIEDLYRNRNRSIEDLNINLGRQMSDVALGFERQLEDMEWALQSWANTSERVWTKFGHSSQYVASNLEDQNRRFKDWMDNLAALRDMGLSEDAIRIMGLDDVQNESQVRALVNSMDDETLARINSEIAQRVEMSEQAAPNVNTAQLERQQERATEDIYRSYSRSLEDLNRSVARSQEDLAINNERAMTALEISTDRSLAALNLNTSRQMADLVRTITGAFYESSDVALETTRNMYRDIDREHVSGIRMTVGSFENLFEQLGITGNEQGLNVARQVITGTAEGFYVFDEVRNMLTAQPMANGGINENHVAQFAPAGAMRLWAEPETGGEAYIPLATSKRQRSLAIWKETGKRLGVEHMEMLELAEGALLHENLQGFLSNLTQFSAAAVQKHIEKTGGMGVGGSAGTPGRYQAMFEAVKAQFPDISLISGFRENAITATGNRSYHGMGRAIDIDPRMDVFNWLKAVYGANTKELIFSPANERQVWNGNEHMYTGITRAQHWDHIHWAMKNGGLLNAFKEGGIATEPSLGLVGEGGKEAMIPLNRKGVQALSDAISNSGVSFFSQSKRDQASLVAAPGHTQAELASALSAVAEAMQVQALSQTDTATYGPIQVVSNDPADMERKLKQRAAYRRLTNPASRA